MIRFTVPIVLAVRTVTGTDAYGNDTYGTVETTVQGVFAPGGSAELTSGRDTVTTRPTVYLPTGTSVAAVDVIKVGGVSYEVDGEPAAYPPNPFTGWQPDLSVDVKLKRVTG